MFQCTMSLLVVHCVATFTPAIYSGYEPYTQQFTNTAFLNTSCPVGFLEKAIRCRIRSVFRPVHYTACFQLN